MKAWTWMNVFCALKMVMVLDKFTLKVSTHNTQQSSASTGLHKKRESKHLKLWWLQQRLFRYKKVKICNPEMTESLGHFLKWKQHELCSSFCVNNSVKKSSLLEIDYRSLFSALQKQRFWFPHWIVWNHISRHINHPNAGRSFVRNSVFSPSHWHTLQHQVFPVSE